MSVRRFMVFLIALVFLRRTAHGYARGSVLDQGVGQFHFASGPAACNRRVDVHCGLQGRPGGSEIDASGGS